MHMSTVSWRSKVLNHRSKDFYFFMYILDGSRRNFRMRRNTALLNSEEIFSEFCSRTFKTFSRDDVIYRFHL